MIGAGIAGLAAAAQLCQAGKNVLVLEGRDRVGGRIHTIPLPPATPSSSSSSPSTPGTPADQAEHGPVHIDLGASWIHGTDGGNPLTALLLPGWGDEAIPSPPTPTHSLLPHIKLYAPDATPLPLKASRRVMRTLFALRERMATRAQAEPPLHVSLHDYITHHDPEFPLLLAEVRVRTFSRL